MDLYIIGYKNPGYTFAVNRVEYYTRETKNILEKALVRPR